jgi:NAD(P)-dependent dehydrogenase (short-subunit alcohol dehydrogenase family)
LVTQKNAGMEALIEKIELLTSDRQKIVMRDFDEINGTAEMPVKMDLAILTSPPANGLSAFEARLPEIHNRMRPGGFVLFIHDACGTVRQRLVRVLASTATGAAEQQPTLDYWKAVLAEYGFTLMTRGAEQHFGCGMGLLVLQARSPVKFALQRSLDLQMTDAPSLADRLLIVGGKAPQTSQLLTDVTNQLRSRCTSIKHISSLEEVTSSDIDTCTAILLLADLDQPILTSLSEAALQALKIIMRPDMLILWVTHNARGGNADHAASFGFSRSLRAETPGLVLQMLDLDVLNDATGTMVAENFARLCLTTQNSTEEELGVTEDGDSILWTFETEVYVENGMRLVERVVPWKEGNDRANTHRRIVTEDVNSLQRCVELVRSADFDGAGAFETEVTDDLKSIKAGNQATGDRITVIVDYSSVDKISYCDNLAPAHLCLGRDTTTGEAMIFMSDRNGSYLHLAANSVVAVPLQIRDMAQFAAWLVRSLSALIVLSLCKTAAKRLILVEPEVAFLDVMRCVCKGSALVPLVLTTSMTRVNSVNDVTWHHVHSQSSDRQIANLRPPEHCEVLDLSVSEHSHLSVRLEKLLPRNSGYHTTLATLRAVNTGTAGILQPAIDLAAQMMALSPGNLPSFQRDSVVGLQRLLDNGATSSFALVDWRADRAVSHITKPIIGPQLLRHDRTYLFVGITRDMGQSLCRLFIEHGARNIVLSSRSPDRTPRWRDELMASPAKVHIVIASLDVTDLAAVKTFKHNITSAWALPSVAGVINGAMVLDDGVFSQMDVATFERVMRPKTIGSANLDQVFCEDELEFFIMTSSFAAIGGHAGQSNYAAANMYMNGLAANRRARGLCATALNIGVIYGLGFLHREKEGLYGGLEREGHPPVSERGLHAMVLEAMACGRPENGLDLTSGLSRFRWPEQEAVGGMLEGPLVLHWHRDPRFSHFTVREGDVPLIADADIAPKSGSPTVQDSASRVRELITLATTAADIVKVLTPAFASRLEAQLHCPKGSLNAESGISELGVDSLVAVEVRAWLWRAVGRDVGVLKILGAGSVGRCE